MRILRAALVCAAVLAVGVALVSGGSSGDPRTPAPLPGEPPPFLGTAVTGDGELTAAVDAYGDVVDLRAGPAGAALIDNPSDRQAAGTVPATTGIVPRISVGGAPPLPVWRGERVQQRYLPGSNVVETVAYVKGVRLSVRTAAADDALALRMIVGRGGRERGTPTISVDVEDGIRCAQAQRGGKLDLLCRTHGPLPIGSGAGDSRGVLRECDRVFREAIVATHRWLAHSTPLGSITKSPRATHARPIHSTRRGGVAKSPSASRRRPSQPTPLGAGAKNHPASAAWPTHSTPFGGATKGSRASQRRPRHATPLAGDARGRASAGRPVRAPSPAVSVIGRPTGEAPRLTRRPPAWARAMYRRSLLTIHALTSRATGAVAAGARDGWAYVWPRDAATAALALNASGHPAEARHVTRFLTGLDLAAAARFTESGAPVPGRAAQGDAAGWVTVAAEAVGLPPPPALPWRDRADYQESTPGTYLANALAAAAPHVDGQHREAARIAHEFGTARGLVRQAGNPESGLDSAAAWAIRPFALRPLYKDAEETLLRLTQARTPYGITPGEGWTGGHDPWSAPTAWTAWSLAALANEAESKGPDPRDPRTNLPAVRERGGPSGRAPRLRQASLALLQDLRRASTPAGALPERVDASTGVPTSTTPLLWSSAFTVLALRELWP